MATILLIDAHDDFRFVLRRLLTLGGHIVREARDGVRGLRMARLSLPEVIVLDLDLDSRGMNGLELHKRLKGTRDTAPIPVIAFTARQPSTGDRGRMTTEFNACLTKPFDLPTFMTALDAILGSRTTLRPLAPAPVRSTAPLTLAAPQR
jgi:CheY-like chemotaxis protein